MGDRRVYPRDRVNLGVECFPSASDGGAEKRRGITQDVSAGGVSFQTASWRGLEVGHTIGLRLSGLSERGCNSGRPRVAKVFATVRRIIVGRQDAQAPAYATIAVEFVERPFTQHYKLTA